ncbi:hypothetical protein [Ensifer aridi]|uniref:hypothetical protein n=1 Tax=Ensifer aridi TaxID=1708715 RepID=UPI0006880965|nr:hypothetical protein [Ensifer aridi]
MKRQSVLALIASALLGGEPQAAEFTFRGITPDEPFKIAEFRLEGEIADADVEHAKAALAKADLMNRPGEWDEIVVSLNSAGGSYKAAIDLALFFRQRGFATVVKTGDRCISACALAFLGGTSGADPSFPDGDALPRRAPDRSIEPGAELAFSPPRIALPRLLTTPSAAAKAHSAALSDFARLLDVAEELHVSADATAPILEAAEDEPYRIDTVEAVRSLGIDYDSKDLILGNLPGVTRSMIMNACINRYHHLQEHRSRSGFSRAASVMKEFIEGSKLLRNGEESRAFGYRQEAQMGRRWLAYMAVDKTEDEKSFVWCIFEGDRIDPGVFYKYAGTVEQLFSDFSPAKPIFAFSRSETSLPIGRGGDERTWMNMLDMVPPETKLSDVRERVDAYLEREKLVPFPD